MLFLAFLTTGARGYACTLGIIMSISMIRSGTTLTDQSYSTNYSQHLLLGALYQLLEALFLFGTSILFMLNLGSGLGKSRSTLIREIFMVHEGVRFVLIMALNFVCAGTVLWAGFGRMDHITHASLYLPSWIYALALYTFLKSSYISAKKMIRDAIVVPHDAMVCEGEYPGMLRFI